MPRAKTTAKPRSVSPKDRKAPALRIAQQRKDGSRKRGQDHSAFTVSGIHSVVKNLRPLPLFEVDYLTEDIESAKGLNSMINSEAKQLQAIEDLYKIVKAQPQYKNLKEPNWKPDTSPFQILTWLLRKLSALADGNTWTVDTWKERKKERFQFVVYKDYFKIKHRTEWMPLDFLPTLKRKDHALHDLVVDTVALVSKANKVPLWDEDGDFSVAIKNFVNGKPSKNRVLEEHRKSYRAGAAAEYLTLLKRRRKVVTPADIEKQIKKYDPKSVRKWAFLWWIKAGLKLSATRGNIKNHSFIPSYEAFSAISPFRLYKFVWNVSNNPVFKQVKHIKYREEIHCPLMFSVVRPGQKYKPIKPSTFPEQLFGFMSDGVGHVLWGFRSYYYPEKKKDKSQMPCEVLLNNIEEAELRVTV